MNKGPTRSSSSPQPVNKFPEAVSYLVQRLKVLCPALGKRKIAAKLARAGLHLSPSSVARMLVKPPAARPAPPETKARSAGKAPRHRQAAEPRLARRLDRHAHRRRFLDVLAAIRAAAALAVLLVAGGRCRPFLAPGPGHHHVLLSAVVQGGTCVLGPHDQQDRRERPSTSSATAASSSIVTDFAQWCKSKGIQPPRYGALGQHGSIAVVERCIRTIKEHLRQLAAIPYSRRSTQRELNLIAEWYNEHRPHDSLGGRTPNEVFYDRHPANRRPRYEPRERWPRGSPCAKPWALVRGRPGARLELEISHHGGRRHLPIVTLRRAA